ncbi:ShlB/FhaC/HecB family hemolysin secretion/activation protein [Blastomonas sp.]|uniref:ShlB/FhaC/HecB family hemolysin secretion/activation protein n=1 Tax=Blastomonas sp. TaxID=1909299 RepID=UPI00260F6006|nr:ShlB/FhaC/HecB family hemolysin secretion/activation protein [Blastomonas sp.]MDM7957468.1 ShlB/FhaC/HecB family hemolysin secretion/activation protein [Blastomonas sp.]
MTHCSAAIGIAAALAVYGGNPAFGQDGADRLDPLIAESETTQQDDPRAPALPPVLAYELDSLPVAAAARSVQVGAVRLAGLETLAQADFMPALEPFLGRNLDADGQRDLVQAVVARLHGLGYPLGQAAIGRQTVAAGVLVVTVDEGRIDAVRIEGAQNDLVDRMFAPLAIGKPVRGTELQRAILLAEAVPGVRVVRAALKQEGTLNILVVRLREQQTAARIAADNWGSDTLGPVKLRGRVRQRSVITDGDEVTGFAITTPASPQEYLFGSVSYTVPVDADGTRIGFSGSVARIDAVGANTGRELEGQGERVRAWIENPVVLTPNLSLGATIGMSYRDTEQSSDGTRSRAERVAALTAGFDASVRVDGMRAFGRVDITRGTGWFGSTRQGDPLASRDDGDARFTLLELGASVISPIAGPLSVRTDVKAQFASRPLLAGDEMGFGGPNFGRGYFFREEAGDNALAGAVEVRVDVPGIPRLLRELQVYGYGDAARLTNLRGGSDHELATAGAGLRAQVTRRFGFGIEIGVPLDQDREPRGNFETWLTF